MNQSVLVHPILVVAIVGAIVSVAGWILLRLRELEIARSSLELKISIMEEIRGDLRLLKTQLESVAMEQCRLAALLQQCTQLRGIDE